LLNEVSLSFSKGHKFQISKNEGLRKIFGPKKGAVSEQFRVLHNEELCDLDGIVWFIMSWQL
jgi:hypothetical protein